VAGEMRAVISCPLSVSISARKKWTLNLNSYRVAHYQILNKAKISFFKDVLPQIAKMLPAEKITVSFVLYRKDQRKCDTTNICAIVDKFLMDALVTIGKIKDDDYTHVVSTQYSFGGIDKANPRVEAIITGE
jgi:hypothetical protein